VAEVHGNRTHRAHLPVNPTGFEVQASHRPETKAALSHFATCYGQAKKDSTRRPLGTRRLSLWFVWVPVRFPNPAPGLVPGKLLIELLDQGMHACLGQ